MRRWWLPTIGAVVLLAILALLAFSLAHHSFVAWRGPSFLPPTAPPPAADPPSRPAGSWPDQDYIWWVTDQLSAHWAMVVKVETDRPHEALAIARHLIEPVSSSYVEVLVYVYPPGRTSSHALRRVQWTRTAGYVELRLDQP